jgi:hypothetical protein
MLIYLMILYKLYSVAILKSFKFLLFADSILL